MLDHKSQEDILLQSCGTKQITSHLKLKSLNVKKFHSKLKAKFVTRLNLEKLQ
jgi:hypothetical protein